MRRGFWTWIAGVEVALAAAAVVLDLLLPTLVLLIMAGLSLWARHERPATLGFHRFPRPGRAAMEILGLTIGWTLLQLSLFMPVVEHLTGQQQDVSQFEDLQGDLPALLGLLLLSWTLAAIGEETAYRGYLLTRITDILGGGTVGVVIAVLGSSVLFGLAHTEQGVVGVIITFLDAIFFSVLRLRHDTVWAPVIAHGCSNTIGLTAFFLVGPIKGLW